MAGLPKDETDEPIRCARSFFSGSARKKQMLGHHNWDIITLITGKPSVAGAGNAAFCADFYV
jgi:hypothetical protein